MGVRAEYYDPLCDTTFILQRSVYPDRLGTNVGKVEKEDGVFCRVAQSWFLPDPENWTNVQFDAAR